MFGIKRLRRENAELRKALSWYAERSNWRKRGTNPPGTTPRTWIKSPAAFDRGARALFVLTQLNAIDVGSLKPPALHSPIDTTDKD